MKLMSTEFVSKNSKGIIFEVEFNDDEGDFIIAECFMPRNNQEPIVATGVVKDSTGVYYNMITKTARVQALIDVNEFDMLAKLSVELKLKRGEKT